MKKIMIYDMADGEAAEIFDKYTSNCQKMFDYVEDILQEDFDGFSEFFLKVIDNKYDFIVLMSRRCLVLFQLFMFLFKFKEEKPKVNSIILSDRALPVYYKMIQNGHNVAIVDDVIVHGRTVSKVYKLIKELCQDAKIDIYGYMADENLNCMSEVLKKDFHTDYIASTNEWRRLSNKIVDSILISCVPYTSFVMAYYEYNECPLLQMTKNNSNILIVQNSNDTQIKQGITSYCIFEKQWNKSELFSELSLGECIRVYYSQRIKRYTVIPYVFIRSLNIGDTDNLFSILGSVVPNEYIQIKSIFMDKENTEGDENLLREYKIRVLTCLLSQLYWETFRKRYRLPDFEFRDIDTLINGFGSDIATELCNISLDRCSDILKINLSNCFSATKCDNICGASEKLFRELLPPMGDWQVTFDKIIKDYLWHSWENDEGKSKKGEDRGQGLILDTYMQIAKENAIDYYQALAVLVNTWDVGTATANFTADVENGVIGCHITCGEQSYRYVLERYPSIMNALITVSNLVTKEDAINFSYSYEKYRKKILLDLLNEFKDKEVITKRYFEDLKEIIESNNGYLNAWNQLAALNINVSDDNNIEEITNIFMKGKSKAWENYG